MDQERGNAHLEVQQHTTDRGSPGSCRPGVAHDITDILHAQKALRESEERLRLAAEVGRMYAWEWDPATDSVFCDPQNARAFSA